MVSTVATWPSTVACWPGTQAGAAGVVVQAASARHAASVAVRRTVDAVRCGFKTQAEVVASGGSDLEDLLVARAAEVDRAEQLGLQFDTNPADDMMGGAMGATPDVEDEIEEPDDPDDDDLPDDIEDD